MERSTGSMLEKFRNAVGLMENLHIKAALELYSDIFSAGYTQRILLNKFVYGLLRLYFTKHESEIGKSLTLPTLSCLQCYNTLHKAVTLACGHTYCQNCLNNTQNKKYRSCCRHSMLESPRASVLLNSLEQKLFPNLESANTLKLEGNELVEKGLYNEAIDKYSTAIGMCPDDHILYSNRSLAHLSARHYTESLSDAIKICTLQPRWPKGFYRKAAALAASGHHKDALLANLHCLYLDHTISAARTGLLKAAAVVFKNFPDAVSWLSSEVIPENLLELLEDTKENNSKIKSTAGILPDLEQMEKKRDLSFMKEPTWILSERIDSSKIDIHDFECTLCFSLLLEPVTTNCGHVFCRSCLNRSLDHQPYCPLCKHDLSLYIAERRKYVTTVLENFLLLNLAHEYEERKSRHEAEATDVRSTNRDGEFIPVCVRRMAYPCVNDILYIIEPHYKLMMRRCMESGSRRFGMAAPTSENVFADFGTILEIQNVEHLQDGRLLVKTLGVQRFRVLERGTRDGYDTAKVEYFSNARIPDEDMEDLMLLQSETWQRANTWWKQTRLVVLLEEYSGPMPEKVTDLRECQENGPDWFWWLMQEIDPLMSLDQHLTALCTTSVKEQLDIIIEFLDAFREM